VEDAFSNAPGSLGDAGYFSFASGICRFRARVDFDDFCTFVDGDSAVGQPAQPSTEGRVERGFIHQGHDLTLLDGIAELELSIKFSCDGRVDIAVAGMPGQGTRFTAQRQGGALVDDLAQGSAPAGLARNDYTESSSGTCTLTT
jgi:hypothetical protein